ncbi:MAG: xylose isomerase, partial [Clostridia bacterium]|nr:xylose isomerase [Clostridia bacterium]
YEDMFESYILGMDTFALGLIKAAAIIEDGRIDSFIVDKYSSFTTGIGAKIVAGETSLEELAAYAAELKVTDIPMSGKQERLEGIVNSVLFG